MSLVETSVNVFSHSPSSLPVLFWGEDKLEEEWGSVPWSHRVWLLFSESQGISGRLHHAGDNTMESWDATVGCAGAGLHRELGTGCLEVT